MFKKNYVKYLFVLSCLIAVAFPMVNVYHAFPRFSDLLIENVKSEAVHIANHLSEMIMEEENDLMHTEKYAEAMESAREDFDLEKIKLFLSSGEVVYSSDPEDIGVMNHHGYFHEIVARGKPYTKLVEKKSKTLEGEDVSTDVVETYVPIMEDGEFKGAFEIYFDISSGYTNLRTAVFNSSMISFMIMFTFFVITGGLLLAEKKKTTGLGLSQSSNTYHSPFYLLSITVISIFVAEAVVMMLLSTFPPLGREKEALIDAALLTILISPALFFFLFQPITAHIHEKEESEKKIQEAYKKIYIANNKLEIEVAERKKAQEDIIQSQKEWEDTFDIMTDAITIHDRDFNIIKSNKAAEKLLDLPFLKTRKTKCYKYYHGTDAPLKGCPSCDCLNTGIPADFELYEPNLRKHIEIRAMPRYDSNNNIIGTIHLVRDISERKEMEEKLKSMSITDDLTGLYNRRGFFNMLDQRLKVLRREKEKAFLLYADLDNFKEINDTLGHSYGDSVLIDTADLLKKTYRESDIIARLGGDEFVVFLTAENESDTGIVLSRLQAHIDTYNAEKKRGYTLSMSIGITFYDPEEERISMDAILARADRSMYEKKQKKHLS